MSYATQRDALSRTPQVIVTVGMTSCANWYAQLAQQVIHLPNAFSDILVWARTNASVTTNIENGPAGDSSSALAQRISYTAATGNLRSKSDLTLKDDAAASRAWTGSVWLRLESGSGTLTLRLEDDTPSESGEVQVTLSTAWVRYSVHKLFTGGAAAPVHLMIKRAAGDVADVLAWGANLTLNPGARDQVMLWPTSATIAGEGSACLAADAGNGSRCHYSRPTCQDPENFNAGAFYDTTVGLQGLKEFKFCLRDAPLPVAGADIWPMIRSVDWVAQEIDPEKAVTVAERVKLAFWPHADRSNWNQDKASEGALTNTTTPSGEFWRRFMTIYRNYSNPRNYVTVKQGFVESGGTEADFVQRGRFLIDNMEIDSDGSCTMELISALRLLRTKAPAKISEGNLLNGAITDAATSAVFDDLSELTAPGSGYTVTIQIANNVDGWATNSEFLNVTAADTDTNTATVQRGRWGSTAVSHGDNSKWREVLMFGTERTTPSLAPLGKNGIDCIVELLRRGGIAAADIDTTTLNAERDTWLSSTVNATTGAESSNLFRRAGNTIDAGNGGISIQTDIEKLIRQIRESIMLSMGVSQDNQITGHIFAPARPSVTLADLTEEANIVKGSLSVNDNEASRVTRVVVCRDLIADRAGDSVEDYQTFTVAVGADEEAPEFYGVEPRTKVVFCPWIKNGDNTTANRLARRLFRRFSNPARKVSFSVEIRDDDIEAMEFVFLTTSRIQKPDGTADPQRIMEVVKKKRAGLGRLSLETLDTAMFGRYGFIAPAGTPNYGSATPQQRRYCFIGTAGQNLVGTPAEAGYRIWG